MENKEETIMRYAEILIEASEYDRSLLEGLCKEWNINN